MTTAIQHVGAFNGHELSLTSLKQLSEVERKNMTISKVEIVALDQAASAYARMMEGKARFRMVLTMAQ